MLTYEEYKEKYGIKNEKTGEARAGIPKELFELLSSEDNFGSILDNHVSVVLINDIFKRICKYLVLKSEGHEEAGRYLTAYKQLGEKFKEVIKGIRDVDKYEPIDRYFDISPEIEERTFFRENVNARIVNKVGSSLGHHEDFYYAVNTKIGQVLRKTLSQEKASSLSSLYGGSAARGTATATNGEGSYFTVVREIELLWNNRIDIYERESKNLKLINRSVRNARRQKTKS